MCDEVFFSKIDHPNKTENDCSNLVKELNFDFLIDRPRDT